MNKEEKYAYDLFFNVAEFLKEYVNCQAVNLEGNKEFAKYVDNVVINIQWLGMIIGEDEFIVSEESYFDISDLIFESAHLINFTGHNDPLAFTVDIKDSLDAIYDMMDYFANNFLDLTLLQCRVINQEELSHG